MSQQSLVILAIGNDISDHMVQNSADLQFTMVLYTYCEESFSGVANVVQAIVIKQNLLDDEGSDGSGEFLTSLHDPEAEWYDLSLH
jgi:hypothetical protein